MRPTSNTKTKRLRPLSRYKAGRADLGARERAACLRRLRERWAELERDSTGKR